VLLIIFSPLRLITVFKEHKGKEERGLAQQINVSMYVRLIFSCGWDTLRSQHTHVQAHIWSWTGRQSIQVTMLVSWERNQSWKTIKTFI